MPFNQDEEAQNIDVKKFQDKGGAKKDIKKKFYKPEDEEEDPEWIGFDPEKEKTKFLGHVMNDESRLRDQVTKRKEDKQKEKADRRNRAAEIEKEQRMT